MGSRVKPPRILLALAAVLLASALFAADHRGVVAQQVDGICGRTTAVQTALLAAISGASICEEVTPAQLSAVVSLDLASKDIASLQAGDFAGLSGVTSINLSSNRINSLPTGLFTGTPDLEELNLSGNQLTTFPAGLFASKPELKRLDLGSNRISSLPAALFTEIPILDELNLSGNRFTAVPDLFDTLPDLRQLNLSGNQISALADGAFSGARALTHLNLSGNSTDPLIIPITIERTVSKEFKVLAPTGAPRNIPMDIGVRNGEVTFGTPTIPKGAVESGLFTIQRTPGKTGPLIIGATVSGTSEEISHSGYTISTPSTLEMEVDPGVFLDKRELQIQELQGITDSGGNEVTQGSDKYTVVLDTDPGGTVTITPTSLDPTVATLETQQLTFTSANWSVLQDVNVTIQYDDDKDNERTTITHTISGYGEVTISNMPVEILDNEQPIFTEGETPDGVARRTIAENPAAGTLVGLPVSATDNDDDGGPDELLYTYSQTGNQDRERFTIDNGTGQLRTKAGEIYDYETEPVFRIGMLVNDGRGGVDSINVIIRLTDVNDAPVFTEGDPTTRSLPENSGANVNVGDPVSATDQDRSEDTLVYSISEAATEDNADRDSFKIEPNTGQLTTKEGVSYDHETKASYSIVVEVSDGTATDTIAVTVNLTDVNEAPTFDEGASTTRSLPENTAAGQNVGAAVSATDQDEDTLTYTLTGDDAGSFEIDDETGQLTTKSGVSYDYEAKSTYAVTVEVIEDTTDNFSDTIAVTVNLTDANDAPVFSEGATATRSVPENSGADVNVGAPVSATDQDRNPADTLTYTLTGTDASSFEIVASSGQLTTKSGVSYDLETKASYSVTVTATDPDNAADTISVTVNLTDVNDAPVFSEGDSAVRSLAENSGASVNVGAAVAATDQDGNTLTYTLSGTDAGSFEIVASSGQLQTKEGVTYNYEAKASYSVTVTATDPDSAADTIAVTINLTDVNDAPTFTEGESATRSLAENTAAGENVGAAVSATDQDGDTLTYTLSGTDAGSFEIVASSGQLTTKSGVSYDLEAKASYSVTVTATDPDNAADSIAVTVNLTDVNDAPTFTEGDSAVRSVPENSGASVDVGNPISATDQDNDTLTYTLTGTDASSFEIVESSGQLTTKSGVSYDLETKASYSVTVTATDPDSAADTIAVTVNLTDVNDAPTFTEGERATRSVPENSGANVNVGLPLSATDQDNDTLTYTLSGTDAGSFEIVASSGQLTTKSGVSYDLEAKASYSVTVTATDPDNATDTIAVTINLTDVNDAPTFTEGESATRSLAENTAAGENVGAAVSATDQDRNPADTLTYTLSGDDAASFDINATTGQLLTKSGVSYDLETKASYTVTVGVSDGTAADSIAVTVNLTDVNDAPTFSEGDSATRSLPENSGTSVNVGAAVAATDQDNDTLTYTLSGTDAVSFEIVASSGQLTTKSGVSYDLETKASYTVTVTATDPDNAADTIAVTVSLTDVNDAPTFTEGDSAVRSVPENSGASVNVGAAVSATDQDRNPADTLTYTLSGDDAASFDINATTGQLTTKSGVSYDLETKASYTVTVTATDPDSAADSIAVTVNLTDVNDAPVFSDGDSTTRSVAENTAAGENVGLPLTATDQDRDADGNPDTLTYTLSGTDAASFEIVETSGQLQTKSEVSYDHEAQASYTVTVTATDPDSAADTIAVTVNLTDVNELPDPPTNLRARPTANAGEVLLEWTPPADNTGRPPITKYEVWNKLEGVADWSDQKAFTTADPPLSTLTITNLKTGQKYDFRVRTVNHEGVSEWAESIASGFPKKPVVTITNKPGNDSPITEGAEIGFLITADPYNNVPLVVKIKVETTGEYGITGRNQDDPLTITIPETGLNQPAPLPHDSGTISTDNDEIDEENGSVTYTIIAAEAYDVGEPKSLTIAIEDNDERKIEVGAISGTIPENGGTATYSVILTSEPTDNVTVTPSSNDQSIATVSGTLTFEPENWNTEQYVTVTGVNDDIDNEGDSRTTAITHTVAGGDYGSLTAEDVTVTVTDDDTKGITFEPTAVTVGEAIGTTSYTVVLDSEPTADVTVTLAIAEVEGTDAVTLATAGTLAFTNTTWDMPQTVELTITDDSFDNTPDDRRTATITHTADGGDYGSVSATLTITVTDDDGPNAAPSFDGTTTTRDLPESIGAATDTGGTPVGDPVTAVDADDATLTYSLSGTDYASFEIDTATGQLQTKAGVTYDHEGKPGYTVTMSVHDGKAADGRPDASIDDSITVTINITDEVEKPNRPPAPTIETTGNRDSLRVIPNAPDNTGRPDIDEYDLQYRPKDSGETFTLESNIGGQGHTLEQLLLNTEYEVQVRARNDEGTGDWSESATQRTGTATATIIATPTTINESGATSRSAITARLEGQLTQDLTLTVSATPEAPAEASDFTLSENVTLTIAAGQTDSSGTVTVTAQDNQVDNDDRTVNVGATSATANLTINGAAITIQDDDTKGITATPDSNVTTEAGGTVTVGVKLNSQPTAAVTISKQSSNTDEGTVSPVDLTFTTGNWNTAQDVTITGQDDSVDDGDTGYAITFTAASPDPRYEGQQASVELTNTDDDTRSVEITTTSTTDPPTLRVSEVAPGNTASYTVVLTSQPSDGNVTVTPVSSAPGNATVSAPLIFTPQNWNTAQPVTITAVDDLIDNEADRTATITHEVAGADYGRHNVVAGSIEVTVTDNDEEGVTVSPTELTVGETGDGSYTIVLNSQPTGTVTVTPAAGGDHPDAIAITPPELTFTTENWNNAQTVTVTGQRDHVDNEADRTATISHSAGGDYAGVTITGVEVTITDSDTAGVTLDQKHTSVTEGQQSGDNPVSYTVVLDSKPRTGHVVKINITVAGPADTDPSSLTFTRENWNVPQSIRVTAHDDGVVSEPRTAVVSHQIVDAESSPEYGTVAVDDVSFDIVEDDHAPVFGDGESTAREVPENSVPGVNVGAAVEATDGDSDTLTYTLGGTDSVFFGIHEGTGQITTQETSYDFETKPQYAITVTASDTHGNTDSIAVTINLTDVNDAPVFTEGDSAVRSLPENSGANVNVGLPLTATDQDRPVNTLVYSLTGTDAESFDIDGGTGQLTTKTGVNYDRETKPSYSVTVGVSDGTASDTITVTVNLTDANDAPTFTEGDSATRSVPENSGANVNVGLPLSATDQDGDTLTYTLTGDDAESFDIDGGTGQLTTKSGVSYDLETKASYTVTVTATDPDNAADTIAVTVNLTDANDAPVFTEGESATRSLPENSGANVNLGAAVAATDQDGNTLTYTLSGADAGSFEIVESSGQLQTKSGASYDLETKASYSVTVGVSDGTASDTITVTVNLTDANDAPVFTEGESATRSLPENSGASVNVGAVVSATDQDNDTLTYTLGGTDAGSFEIVESSGQLTTKSGVSYDLEAKASYSVTVTATDPDSAADTIAVTVNLTDANDAPTFDEGDSTTRSLAENTAAGENVGAVVSATDQDGDTLTYTLSGTDADSFEIDGGTGQLKTKSGVSYDLETKASYTVTVTATDSDNAADTITVTVNLTDANDAPTFTEGDSATRSVPENSGANVNVGAAVTATDQDTDTLTYTLTGTDATSFEIVESSGQLTTKSGVSYNYEAKASYTVTVGVSDGTAADSIAVTVNLTDVNDAPVFSDGDSTTRSLAENSGANVNVGAAVTATDQDTDTLTYTLSGDDAGSFDIDGPTGQLQTKSGVSYDLEAKASYSVTVTATDPDSAADTIAVTINLTDVNDAPVFTDGDTATRSVPENSGANVNVGLPLSATDQDTDTLTYTLGGADAGSFEIVASSGQLTTKSGVSYDLEAKASYSVTVGVEDPEGGSDSITVTINLTDANDAPVFIEGENATRSLPENSGANVNLGAAVAATDQDGNTLTYTLSGADAGSFEIVESSGQLTTKSGVSYDLETKASYSVTVTATDPDSAADSISVTVNLTDVNDAPTFTEGESATRSLPENSGANVNVGDPVTATDQDGDTLTYTLSGTDAGSFDINATGQLQTKSGVSYDYEAKQSYSVTVGVSDGTAADTIAVTVNLTDVNEVPTFNEGDSTTRNLAENTPAGENIGEPVAATDPDGGTLTYALSGTDAGSFAIVASSGQLTTKSGVTYDYESPKKTYSITVGVRDPQSNADTIAVTVNLTDANDAPVFTEGESTTRSLAENTAAGQNVGSAVSATDQDNDTLTYTLSGTDAASFEIDGGTGQLTTKQSVTYDYETKPIYSVTVGVNDRTATDSIAVTVNLIDVNDPGRGLTVVAQTVRENAGTVGVAVNANGRTTLQFTCWADLTDSATTVAGTDFTGLGTTFAMGTTLDYSTTTTRTVNVTVVNDAVDENNEALVIRCKLATDVGGTAADTLTIQDDDTRGFRVSTSALRVTEGGSRGYTVVLASQPTADSVTVTPSSDDVDAATVSSDPLTFTTSNWNYPQTVTVTSPEDEDALHAEATITHSVSAAGTDYDGLSVPPVTVTVRDNDVSGYLIPDDRALSYNERFILTLPEFQRVTGSTTKDQMREIRGYMWDKLPLPDNIQTLYPGIDAHNSVLCWQEVRQPSYTHTWSFYGMDGRGVQITRPSDFQESDRWDPSQYAYGPTSGFLFQFPGAPAVRQDTTLTFRLTVRKQVSWLEDRECNGGVTLVEVEVPVKATTVGFAERVGTVPPMLLQAGSSRYFDVKPYFGPAPDALRYEVAVAPAGVANVRLRGSDPTRGLSPTDIIVEGIADGEAVVTVKASADQRYGGATAVQAFRVIVGEQGAIPIRYAPDQGQTEMDVYLNDYVLEGVFDYTYKEWSHGRYRPYEWSWEQLSGPTIRLYQDEHGALFGLPDFPQGTLLKFRVTATQNPRTLVRTGQDASSPATRSYDLLLRVGNPGNIRPLGRPTANAGRDRSANTGAFLSLDSTNSVSPTGSWTDLDFRWEVESAPNRVLTELRNSIASSYEEGAYNGPYIAYFNMPQLYAGEALVFKLTASIWGQTSTDTVRITSSNPLPVANAGPDREQAPGERVVLRGSGSLNPQVQDVPVEYAWTQMSESTVALSGAATANPWFVLPENAPAGRALRFELTVTDSEGRSDSDTMTVTVAGPVLPTACAGPDMTGAPGDEVTLQGKCSVNPYGRWHEMTYQWTQLSGPAVTLTHPRRTQPAGKFADPSFTIPADAAGETTLEFQLTVTDQEGQSDSDTMIVTVAAPEVVRPTATAGPDLSGAPGESVTLQGKGSVNPYGRWHQMAHQWTQLSGPPVTLTHPKTSQPASKFADPSFTIPADAAGGTTLEFQLTVTDKEGQSDSDTMTVTVTGAEPENTPPTASIDATQVTTAEAGETVALQGVGNDAETAAESLTFAWTQVGGTPTVSIASASTATASFTAPDVTAETSLTFRLTVTDEDGLSATAETTVAINPPPEPENTPPTASIDAAQVTTAEAGETVALQGVGGDAETAAGSLTFAWSQVGGTPTVSIANASTATASFTAPDVTEETSLTFRLTVTDEGGLSATAETTVAVSPPPQPENTPPTASIDAAQVTTAEAGDTVQLQGVGNDAETAAGSLTFAWSQVGGTPTVSIANASTATASFTAPDVTEETALTFRLTVTDQGGLSTTAETTIAVSPPPEPENTPPTASIDAAQVTTAEAGETVELRGVGNDAETAAGSLTFAWSHVSGTPTVSIISASTATASFTAPDVTEETSLTFRLTVTDQDGLSATAETTIAINPPPEPENTPPTASIDAAQVTTAEAGETVELRGVGNDAETAAGSLTFAWTQVGGTPSVSIVNASAATASFTAPDVTEETSLTFRLTVTDEGGLSATAETTVTISPLPEPANTPPTASIDAAQVAAAEAGETVQLQGVGNDAETAVGSLTFAWSQVGGTPTVSIANATTATANFTAPDVTEETSLTFRLTVTDEVGLSATAETTVTISPPPEPEPNRAPTFDANTGTVLTVAENSRAGTNVGSPITATDPDGDTPTYSLSGADAGSFSIDATTGQVTTRSGVVYDYEAKQAYSLAVSADDGKGLSASIPVTVNLTDVNEAPAFDEGASATRQVAENSGPPKPTWARPSPPPTRSATRSPTACPARTRGRSRSTRRRVS